MTYKKKNLQAILLENNEIYSDAPDFTKVMAREANEEHRKMFFDTDFFTFINEKYGEPLLIQVEIRKELEEEYNTCKGN